MSTVMLKELFLKRPWGNLAANHFKMLRNFLRRWDFSASPGWYRSSVLTDLSFCQCLLLQDNSYQRHLETSYSTAVACTLLFSLKKDVHFSQILLYDPQSHKERLVPLESSSAFINGTYVNFLNVVWKKQNVYFQKYQNKLLQNGWFFFFYFFFSWTIRGTQWLLSPQVEVGQLKLFWSATRANKSRQKNTIVVDS